MGSRQKLIVRKTKMENECKKKEFRFLVSPEQYVCEIKEVKYDDKYKQKMCRKIFGILEKIFVVIPK